jgi:L-arabinokinase
MAAFPRQVDVPLLTAPSAADRAGLSQLTGADPGRFWVLLSFTTLDWTAEAVARVTALDGYEFFTVEPLTWPGSGIHAIARDGMPFAEVLASVDAVVSKPGYGIVSECVVNEKPLLYADRQNFREYPILVAAIERCLCQAHLPSDDLYAGNLGPGLVALRSAPGPTGRPARGGEKVVAARILATLDAPSP